tara:strand:- start:7714 stop:9054 length:1341 start_codon:yes stop_codon:yes gene_type:complete
VNLFNLNKKSKMSVGPKLYQKAKSIIPGGTQLLSKRPEMFLPGVWPSYYKKARGCHVWDLDNNKFTDMSIMGIGTCSLGYANKKVNKAVKKAVNNGSFSTLNSYEEVELSEKLIDLHPYMEMIRFTRSGGEANAMAARIGRVASRKTRVAVCGYHGWHDWYLAANLGKNDNLDGLLLPGLSPEGVPKELKNTTLTFHYGNIKELENLVDKYDDIGVICVEVQRGKEVDLNFLQSVRKIANKIKAVLIFDEISSGFRLSIGGLYKLHGLEPDLLVLGKALGNGYGISAVLGKKSIMEEAQKSFISSSYWTERTSYAAALETINQFEKKDVIEYLIKRGIYFDKKMSNLFNQNSVSIGGIKTVPNLIFNQENGILTKTIFTQEMLKRGFLASNVIYFSLSHTNKIIDHYFRACQEVLDLINSKLEQDKLPDLLDGEISHSGFQRLTTD